jgi:hypothetical protein
MNTKTCFKCKTEKPLGAFYAHPMMADGHLGKCKECTKVDAQRQRMLNVSDPEWVRQERERCRLKAIRYRAAGGKPSAEALRKGQEKHRLKNPDKCRTRCRTYRAMLKGTITKKTECECCGATGRLHKHHVDYNKPLDIRWLCTKCHGVLHRKA